MNALYKKNTSPKVIFLMGPTASGKTSLAIELHRILPVELISVDSALIYREMNIGTAKPSIEELRTTPHRLLNIINPDQSYSVANFYRDALVEMDKIISAGNIPLLVGGTMLFYKILLEGLSPLPSADFRIRKYIQQQAEKYGCWKLHQELMTIDYVAAERIHPNDLQRISRALEVFFITGKTLTQLTQTSEKLMSYKSYQFAIIPSSRELLYKRIEQRFYRMLDLGFVMEAQSLFDRGYLCNNTSAINCIGYRQMWLWLTGKISYNEMIYQSICATKKLAKRQTTWLHNWKYKIYWLDSEQPKQAVDKILYIIGHALTN